MFYWMLIALSVFLVPLSYFNFQSNKHGSKILQGRDIYLALMFTVLILVVGFRSYNVGIDTGQYQTLFNYVANDSSFFHIYSSWQSGHDEVGYVGLEFLISRFFNFSVFLMICALISLVPVWFIIKSYSSNFFLSIFLFISFGYYFFTLTGIRQSLAIGICLMAFNFASHRRLKEFLVCVLIATLFHGSAIIFLPAYWIHKISFNKATVSLYLVCLVIVNVFKSDFFMFIRQFARMNYGVTDNAGGVRMYLFMLFTVGLGFVFHNQYFFEDEQGRNHFIFYLLVGATLIWPIASFNPAVFRLYFYYHIFIILFVPNFLKKIHDKLLRLVITLIFISVGIYFMSTTIYSNMRYLPYSFFWEQNL